LQRPRTDDFADEHNRRVFEFQHFSTKVIFWVVLFLVFSGVFFAALQFFGFGGGRGANTGTDTEFAASIKGVNVKSPVMGIVILAMSLAFYFLYLKYVYPITVVSLQ